MTTSSHRRCRISETDQLIGATLRSIREQRGVSEAEMAAALSLQLSDLSSREEGRTSCSAGEIWKAAALLKTPVQVLFQGVHADNLELQLMLEELDVEERLLAMFHACPSKHRDQFMNIVSHETSGLRDDLA